MNKTRPKQLSFRVSEEEYQQLQEKISESGKNQESRRAAQAALIGKIGIVPLPETV